VSNQAFDDYKDGHEEGSAAAEDPDALQTHIDVWIGVYGGKTEMWWRGFKDGKAGVWDPPEQDDEDDEE